MRSVVDSLDAARSVEAVAGGPHSVRTRPSGLRRRQSLVGYAFVLPFCSAIGFLTLYPTAKTLLASFFRSDPLEPPSIYVGLQNFRDLFAPSTDFVDSLVNTLWYVLFGTILVTVIGFGIALALRSSFRGRGVVMAILILPWALPGVVEGVIWSWIYDPSFGVLNSLLKALHITSHYAVLVGGHSQLLSIFLMELVLVWQMTPLEALLILASLQVIPPELYEYAAMDGAGPLQTFRRITLPLVRPGLAIATVNAVISSFTVFDIVYVLSGGTGALATNPVMMTIYNIAFQNENFGEAYAAVFLFSAGLMLVSGLLIRLIYRKVEY